jgi:glycosyltransferase involved in cell wall biosynthesis
MLFLRRFHAFTGGALKTFHYFAHARASGLVEPRLMLFPPRAWDGTLAAWLERGDLAEAPGDPAVVLLSREWDEADRLGLTGPGRRIIHLVQHVAHAQPGTPEYASLARPATRIAVSPYLAERLRACAALAGEVVLIDEGVEVLRPALPWEERAWDATVAALKNPALGAAVAAALTAAGRSVRLITQRLPRPEFLDLVAAARVLVALPHPGGESFFLPPLEAMRLDVAVVAPDALGARGHCIDGVSCLVPGHDAAGIARRTLELLGDAALLARLRGGGAQVAARYTLAEERRRFTEVLGRVLGAAPAR